jgi:hypothetical protein
MPCPGAKRHVLYQFPIAADQAVGRDPQLMNTGEIGVSTGIEAPQKQIVDKGATKLPGGRLMPCITSRRHPPG